MSLVIGTSCLFAITCCVLCRASFKFGKNYNPDNYQIVTNKNVSHFMDFIKYVYSTLYKAGKSLFYPGLFIFAVAKLCGF